MTYMYALVRGMNVRGKEQRIASLYLTTDNPVPEGRVACGCDVSFHFMKEDVPHENAPSSTIIMKEAVPHENAPSSTISSLVYPSPLFHAYLKALFPECLQAIQYFAIILVHNSCLQLTPSPVPLPSAAAAGMLPWE